MIIIGIVLFYGNSDTVDFGVDSVLLKFSVKANESVSKTLTIRNGAVAGDFTLVNDFGFLTTSESVFYLTEGEEKKVEVLFNTDGKPVGVYHGKLIVKKNDQEVILPIIFEIESRELLFDNLIHVAPEYSDVYAGGKLVVENKIFNLENIGKKTVEVTYRVSDFNENTIFEENEMMIIDNQILSTKIIAIPEGVAGGKYVYSITTRYMNSVGTSSYIFEISRPRFIDRKDFIFWVGGIVLFIFLGFIFYNFRERDKFFLQLEKQHKRELRQIMQRLETRQRNLRRLPAPVRRAKVRQIKIVKKIIVKKANDIYKKRYLLLKKLKKEHKPRQIENKLKTWKKEGYAMNEFLSKHLSSAQKAGGYKRAGYGI